MSDQAIKIVIVAGNQFSVPLATATEAVRQQLLGMGFADVASAEAKEGKSADGTPTLEFIKKAGTKGLDGAELAALLRQVPPVPVNRASLDAVTIAARLLDEALTWGEALEQDAAGALDIVAGSNEGCATEGGRLCARLALPAAAAPVAAW
jgi:hypothetical protein